jgi:hypothetical protein
MFYLDVVKVYLVLYKCCNNYTRMLHVNVLNVSTVLNVVASVLSRCCICCTGYTHMLQVYVSNISAVSNVCCKCFIWMLYMLQCPYIYVASVCNSCFICFGRILQQMLHVASVSLAGVATGHRQRWSPQAQRSLRAREKPSGHDSKRGAQSCIHRRGSRCGTRSYIHVQLFSLSLSLF